MIYGWHLPSNMIYGWYIRWRVIPSFFLICVFIRAERESNYILGYGPRSRYFCSWARRAEPTSLKAHTPMDGPNLDVFFRNGGVLRLPPPQPSPTRRHQAPIPMERGLRILATSLHPPSMPDPTYRWRSDWVLLVLDEQAYIADRPNGTTASLHALRPGHPGLLLARRSAASLTSVRPLPRPGSGRLRHGAHRRHLGEGHRHRPHPLLLHRPQRQPGPPGQAPVLRLQS